MRAPNTEAAYQKVKMSVIEKINKLKKQKNAVILAHNYQLPEIQDIADFCGDSLGLSVEASKTKAGVIVFCGVYFMAETAKILSPRKRVIIPDKAAGCPMADMITQKQLMDLQTKHPKAKTMCYVNSPAEVKALSYICCTSSNAVKIAERAFTEDDEIIFVPDQYLAKYTASQIKRKFIFWKGFCPTHARILPEHVTAMKKKYPDAQVLAHPECSGGVIALADKVLSTGGMMKYVKDSRRLNYIIGTEEGMVYALKKQYPGKNFYCVNDIAVCPNMKKITLDKVVYSLENMKDEVVLSESIIEKSQASIRRMIELS